MQRRQSKSSSRLRAWRPTRAGACPAERKLLERRGSSDGLPATERRRRSRKEGSWGPKRRKSVLRGHLGPWSFGPLLQPSVNATVQFLVATSSTARKKNSNNMPERSHELRRRRRRYETRNNSRGTLHGRLPPLERHRCKLLEKARKEHNKTMRPPAWTNDPTPPTTFDLKLVWALSALTCAPSKSSSKTPSTPSKP